MARLAADKEGKIVDAIKRGVSVWTIREECRTCCRTVRKVAQRHGLIIRTGRGPQIARLRLIYLLDMEHGATKAGEMLGINHASVSNAVRRYLAVLDKQAKEVTE